MKLYSLRRATLLAIIVPLVLVVALISISTVLLSGRAISVLRDDQMEQEAAFLMVLAKHEAAEGEAIGLIATVEPADLHAMLGTRTGFRIWSGKVLMTQSAPNPAPLAGPPPEGFSNRDLNGKRWRIYALRHPELPITIEVSEPYALRTTMVRHIVESLIVPLLLLIFATSLIAYLQVTRAMRPMRAISRDVDRRDSNDLQPLSGHSIPIEIAPFLAAFNRLIERLRLTIDREREFADNAAHELRTPLAALKTRAQIVARELEGDAARQESAIQLVAATDRATAVIDHLLLLNRLANSSATPDRVDFSELVADVARDLAPLALDRNQGIGADIAPGICVAGHRDALRILVRNLIDNAIRYTPAGGAIGVSLSREEPAQCMLRVTDDGPGIPADRLEAVFDRFVRLSHNEPGSGLGLSIARRVVEQHHGTIRLENRPRGIVVIVALPIA